MNASSFVVPHISAVGRSETHTAGRSGRPNSMQRLSALNCTQRTPAGLPSGIPGIGDEIEGAIQHAPHPARQSNRCIADTRMVHWTQPSVCGIL